MTHPEPDNTQPELTDAETIAAARKPAYDAVFAYIGTLPLDDQRIVERNARIWRAVNAALDAMNVGRCISSHCVEGDHVLIADDTEAGA